MKRKMKNSRWGRNLVTAALALLVGGGMAAGARLYAISAQETVQKEKAEGIKLAEEQKRLDQVKVWRVFPLPLTDTLKLPGTLEAYQDVDIAAKVSGTVQWLGPKEGDAVKQGEKLLQLDIETLKAEVERAQANVDLAQANFQRISSLFEKRVASKEEFDSNRTQLKTAQAALAQAEAHLADGTLLAPMEGIIDRKQVDQGEHVNSGQTVLKLVDIKRVKALVNVPEKDALFFKRGQSAKVHVQDGNQEKVLEGTIEWVALTAESSTRTYPLKIVVDNGDLALRPGMIVRVELIRRQLPEAIAVPFFSIIEQETSKSVFVVNNDVVQEKPIRYGVFQNGLVEILDGLKDGDALVVVGQRNLVHGEKVVVAQDLTDMARQYIKGGGDLSRLAMEYQ